MRQPSPAYPPGHPRRAELRAALQKLGSTSVRVNFETRDPRYHMLSYGLKPVRHKLSPDAAGELQAVATAWLQAALPPRPSHDGKQGELVWQLDTNRMGISY